MEIIRTYSEFNTDVTISSKAKYLFRNNLIRILSFGSDLKKNNNWIRFPYYHHVFDDEKHDFERQMKYLRNYGEFISIDTACILIDKKEKIDGRFFCISFDDGYECCYTNMLEITKGMDIPVIIYLPTDFIGLNPEDMNDYEMLKKNTPKNSTKVISFLSWDQCKEMMDYNVTFGSHTMSHANLNVLNKEQLTIELKESKEIIEKKLQVPCNHFACPWGKINENFKPEIVNPVLNDLGYISFATTHRGLNDEKSDLFFIKRDHILAEWDNSQLKYFFSR